MTTDGTAIRAGGHAVRINRPDKVLFPADGLTKADLAGYYRTVARRMLPHLRGRPLTLQRFPDGTEEPGFMQKDTPDYFPAWIARARLPKQQGGTVGYPLCSDTATLVYLADQATVTLHRLLSKADDPEHPDRMVFDLDPAGDDFAEVRGAAQLLRELLDELALPSTVMTTGSRGLHVIVPLDGRAGFEESRAFARAVAEVLAGRSPDTLTTEARKAARGDRLYLDVQRNAYGQTAVAPYAVRPLPGAPVAAPLSWDDVDTPGLTARRWTVRDAGALVKDNPWREALRGRSLAPARRRLDALRRA
ncbi:non-homologous end-joining DNA ligase [Streptomyces sp. V4-01]|uniref:Non-homologous end-joining DNA ligase n=1 Tax=Actinacidiphila polyblastidii TaxID=3110430 RepID=A0ABU7PFS2_9ACTN|nr:non-homologous end-joining DNA ligase [Streptomyces sp. V4-01]